MKINIIVGGKFHAFNLAKQINKRGHLNKIITSYPSYKLEEYGIKKKDIQSYFLKEILSRIFSKLPFINFIFDLDYLFNNHFDKVVSKNSNFDDVDIVVGWSSFSENSFLKAKQFKCKKILERGSAHIVFQNDILKNEYNKMKITNNSISKKIISKELREYEIADYIVVPSNFAKKTFLDKGFKEEKIISIPLGVDLKKFDISKDSAQKRIRLNKFRIISTGRLSIRKGTHYLLEAFKSLNLENSELLLVGDIDKNFKDIFNKFKHDKKIRHYKSQPEKNLKDFYNISDIFVSCSLEDGFSMVQLQAMACGLPIISTYNTGASELIDDGQEGFVLPIKDVNLLKDKINILYNNKELRSVMSRKSYLKAQSNLTWDHYGDRITKFYESILV